MGGKEEKGNERWKLGTGMEIKWRIWRQKERDGERKE
jgi:hypothetical protein